MEKEYRERFPFVIGPDNGISFSYYLVTTCGSRPDDMRSVRESYLPSIGSVNIVGKTQLREVWPPSVALLHKMFR